MIMHPGDQTPGICQILHAGYRMRMHELQKLLLKASSTCLKVFSKIDTFITFPALHFLTSLGTDSQECISVFKITCEAALRKQQASL